MKEIKAFFYVLFITVFVLNSCSSDDINENDQEGTEDIENPTIPEDPGDQEDEELITNSQDVNYENAIIIYFSDSGVTVDNSFAESGVTVDNQDGHITITSSITDLELNYVLSGITSNGSVKIYGEKKFGLILNGVGITNPNGAAINIQNKKKCMLNIVTNTNNRLIDGTGYVFTDGEDMKATFFSEGNTEVSGSGNLEIRGKYKHALCIDGSLLLSSGTVNIKEAASDGIHTNDGIDITGGALTIRSVGDGIDCESTEEPINITGGDVSITTTGEKGHAVKTKHNINIDTNGSMDITVYGAASKGLKPTGDLTISNGNIAINTAGVAIWDSDEQDTSSAAGVKCDGNFLMENGTLVILSTGAGGKGINVDGTLIINNGVVSVTTTGDQYVYNKDYDTAAKGIKSTGDLTINGGSVKIRTSKTEAEGLESKSTLTINGGDINIETYDDGINASNHIQITGGTIYVNSEVNDALDSNGTLTITGGTMVLVGATNPEGGIDCDQSTFKITGGLIVGIGGTTSTPTSSVCTQRSVVYNTSSITSGQFLQIKSSDENILVFKMPRTYSSMAMLFSSSDLASGITYTINKGGSVSGGTEYHGLYTGATYSGGSSANTFTSTNMVSTVGSSGGRPN